MTSYLMPFTKRMKALQSIMRNKATTLYSTKSNTKLYSADFSKSTDPISIPLARFVLNELIKHLGKPTWWDQAMDAVINEHKLVQSGIHDGKITKCGALMGQGPGWTVLCILNDFAANYKNSVD